LAIALIIGSPWGAALVRRFIKTGLDGEPVPQLPVGGGEFRRVSGFTGGKPAGRRKKPRRAVSP
jgi:hypothetical protein